MDYLKNKLTAKVIATNRVNKNAIELYAQLSKAFAPFVGQKIEKVDGSLLSKVANALPKFAFRNYRSRSNYSLFYICTESEMVKGETSCVYAERSVYIGEMSNGILVKLCDVPSLRFDYTTEEIEGLRKVAEDARQAARNAESALAPFGFYDN